MSESWLVKFPNASHILPQLDIPKLPTSRAMDVVILSDSSRRQPRRTRSLRETLNSRDPADRDALRRLPPAHAPDALSGLFGRFSPVFWTLAFATLLTCASLIGGSRTSACEVSWATKGFVFFVSLVGRSHPAHLSHCAFSSVSLFTFTRAKLRPVPSCCASYLQNTCTFLSAI